MVYITPILGLLKGINPGICRTDEPIGPHSIGNLIDMLDQFKVGLVLAAPGRNLDLSGNSGKIATMIMALMDEYYATDTSEKQKDSVRHRRGKGIIVGGVPFGTVRNKQGILQRSNRGAWLLSDGTFVKGSKNEPPAEDPNAIWLYETCQQSRWLSQTESKLILVCSGPPTLP